MASATTTTRRKIIVHLATSADGFIARADGDMEWLTERPAPKGFYGLPEFERSVDTKILGRKTFAQSLALGARFSASSAHYVFSRQTPPPSLPAGVRFVTEPIRAFADRLRGEPGKHIWLMGGGEIIGAFLDEGAIDEFIVTVVPVFIGTGIPLLAPRHRQVALSLRAVQQFPDGVVQVHYELARAGGWSAGAKRLTLLGRLPARSAGTHAAAPVRRPARPDTDAAAAHVPEHIRRPPS